MEVTASSVRLSCDISAAGSEPIRSSASYAASEPAELRPSMSLSISKLVRWRLWAPCGCCGLLPEPGRWALLTAFNGIPSSLCPALMPLSTSSPPRPWPCCAAGGEGTPGRPEPDCAGAGPVGGRRPCTLGTRRRLKFCPLVPLTALYPASLCRSATSCVTRPVSVSICSRMSSTCCSSTKMRSCSCPVPAPTTVTPEPTLLASLFFVAALSDVPVRLMLWSSSGRSFTKKSCLNSLQLFGLDGRRALSLRILRKP
mmetsp:Transcript_7053/g.14644  ORF Transcript_7053/g.14644 Transcript_7053/m.14644 type:complete len:256 (+) Transcript_7053:662-1429(+)